MVELDILLKAYREVSHRRVTCVCIYLLNGDLSQADSVAHPLPQLPGVVSTWEAQSQHRSNV